MIRVRSVEPLDNFEVPLQFSNDEQKAVDLAWLVHSQIDKQGFDHMAYTKTEAIAIIRVFLEKIEPELPIERAYLFGSHATGRTRDYSDIDLAIVTPALNAQNSIAINQKVFSRASRYNLDLEPICFSLEEFEKEELPIVRDINRTGIEINAH